MGKSGGKLDANKCKANLKLSLTRINLQKSKKANAADVLKNEIAGLLRAGKDESARIKVETVIRDAYVVEVLEIVALFSELLIARMGILSTARDCPPDLVEAVSTIIYAAPRLAIKELTEARAQLGAKFGKAFGMEAMQNKNNCVNSRVVSKLAVQTPENAVVYQFLNAIAEKHGVDWKVDVPAEPVAPRQQQQQAAPAAVGSGGGGDFDFDFPEPPKSNVGGSVSRASAPSPMNSMGSEPEIPTFDVSALPGGHPAPSSSAGADFDFPSIPSSGGGSSSGGGDLFDFPSIPGEGSSAAGGASGDGVPDFDDLSARFERLRKK